MSWNLFMYMKCLQTPSGFENMVNMYSTCLLSIKKFHL